MISGYFVKSAESEQCPGASQVDKVFGRAVGQISIATPDGSTHQERTYSFDILDRLGSADILILCHNITLHIEILELAGDSVTNPHIVPCIEVIVFQTEEVTVNTLRCLSESRRETSS